MFLKTPENFWFSEVFRGYRIRTWVRNGLTGEVNPNKIMHMTNHTAHGKSHCA